MLHWEGTPCSLGCLQRRLMNPGQASEQHIGCTALFLKSVSGGPVFAGWSLTQNLTIPVGVLMTHASSLHAIMHFTLPTRYVSRL